ncbi:hypothetical protein H1R20_g12185, partial [Candolleomyces eurysporus]
MCTSAAVVNGIHPGPLIVAQKGDNFDVLVTNNLTDPSMTLDTSIHWHGIFQRGTTWADGPEGFSPNGQAGSFWYHSHFGQLSIDTQLCHFAHSWLASGNQYCDGVRGPIVIYDENDPHRALYDEDNEDTVITADGESTVPTDPVDGIQIFAGQRYSFILHANQNMSDNYWIRANPNIGPSDQFQGGVNSAILRYVGGPEVDPTTPLPPSLEFLRESDLHPFANPAAPGLPQIDGSDFNQTFEVNFQGGRFLMNNASWQAPSAPILLQILTGSNASELMPQASIVHLRRNQVVQLNITSISSVATPHPFHLHGHAFSVIKSADSDTFNFENPVRRDVVSIGGVGQFAVIRFVTDNPGPWIFHCHIEPHLSVGLAVVFVEDFENILPSNPIPQSWRDLCDAFERSRPTLPASLPQA